MPSYHPHALSCSLALLVSVGAGACSPSTETLLSSAPRAAALADLDEAAVAQIEKSVAALEGALDQPRYWTQLGMVYHAYRHFELARTCYQQRNLREANDAKTWHLLAQIEHQLGQTEMAAEQLERCIEIDPGYAPAHWRLGLFRLALGDVLRAEAAMQAALALAPFDAAAVVGLARVRLQQEQSDDAVTLLEGHLTRLPSDNNARFLLGTAYRKAGRMEDAARVLASGSGGDAVQEDPWLGEVFSLRRGYRHDFLEALELLGQGNLQEAIRRLEALNERQPEDTLIHLSLHRAYRMDGQLERAIELMIAARRLDPLQDMVHLHLAGAYRDQARANGNAPEMSILGVALESAVKACELSPTFANGQGMRGDILMDMQRFKEAADAYARAADLDRTSFMWHDKAARSLCQSNRWADAVPVLERLDLLRPSTPNILLLLSMALSHSGRPQEALEPLQRAKALAPSDPSIRKALEELEAANQGHK